ncbi:UNVERIFIED_CONTAM: hypothetical protein Sradi_6981000 [Sesamum radiatum]|uniref:Reverse transcriptase n=1 Tax=Sesamum radiatum TaxID=300843 RepID=A0AAW2JE61_SESRA
MQSVGRILRTLEVASRFQINLQKSFVAYSKNFPAKGQEALAAILGIRVVTKHEKYLGIPAVVGQSKREVFSTLRTEYGQDSRVGSAKLFHRPTR